MEAVIVKTDEFYRYDTSEKAVLCRQQGLVISRRILLQFLKEDAVTNELIEELWTDCVEEWLVFGGTLPKESLLDWLYFRKLIPS